MVRSAAIDWINRASRNDAIRACAKVASVSEREAFVTVTVEGSESGQLLQTETRLVPTFRGRYAAIDPDALKPSAACAASFADRCAIADDATRSEEHTSELQSRQY